MQYNNIANTRVPHNTKKGLMASSLLFPQNKNNFADIQSLNKKQPFIPQKNETREVLNVPTFLQSRKPQGVSQSIIFNTPPTQYQSTFQNPFISTKYPRGSVEESKKFKEGVPSFLKNEDRSLKQQSLSKGGFYKKFKSPDSLKSKTSLYSSAPITNDSLFNRPRVDSRVDSKEQTSSPISSKRPIQFLNKKSALSFLNRKFSQKKKQKNDSKQDQKSTMSVSQKSSKVPEFLKKISPQNNNHKQLSAQQLSKTEKLFNIYKVNTQPCTQPQFPIDKRMNMAEGRSAGFTNYVEIQNSFSKKKQNEITSASFAKISNTPQSPPVKLQYPKFQFGRLSSPSSFNNRKPIDTTYAHKQFSVNNFQLVDKIGKGAFGDVYIAMQKLTGFLCVLKKVSKRRIKELKLQQNILREIKIQSYLRHKHLTSLFGFFSDQEYLYLILEILPDGSMSQVKKKKRTPELQVARYVRQVCQGLRYMHKQDIIHRDLKPENVFLNLDYLKIGDFGCAVYTQTLRKTIVGCMAYISPEQLNNDFYDDKIDVWSLGILTYELVTGKAPFQQEIAKISRQQLQPKLSKLYFPQDLQISDICRDFITRLLQLNPQDRISIDQTMRHPFIAKILDFERKQQLQIFGQYQAL